MQPNGTQNFWQPETPQEPQPAAPPQPVAPPQQPIASAMPAPTPVAPAASAPPTAPAVAPQPVVTPTPASDPMPITPHDEAFVPPAQSTGDPEDVYDDEAPLLSWEASEFINHEKDTLWFIGFAVVVLAFLAGAILLQAWTFVALVVIMAIATVVYVRRPPRTLRYSVSEHGLHIGDQFHAYTEFRAFDVVDDGPFYALVLVSRKRFMPATLIYFAEQDGQKIVDIFSHYLPMEDLKLDLVDLLIRKLRL